MRKVGLDGNRPVENGVPAWRVYPPDFMAGTGTAYVRINFLLDQWSSPTESGWLQVYDAIVNGLTGRGIEVYGSRSSSPLMSPTIGMAGTKPGFIPTGLPRCWSGYTVPSSWSGDWPM
jgi:hypothetical protein